MTGPTADAIPATLPAGLEAVKYRVLATVVPGDLTQYRTVYIEERRQRDDSQLWAVTRSGEVLNRDGEWEYEPLPSSRDDEFIARTRFASVADAMWSIGAWAAKAAEGGE